MLSTIGHWLITIPVDNPWRAIILVLMVLAIAFILHMLWELGFMLGGALHQMSSRFKLARNISASRSFSAMPVAQTSETGNISPKSDI